MDLWYIFHFYDILYVFDISVLVLWTYKFKWIYVSCKLHIFWSEPLWEEYWLCFGKHSWLKIYLGGLYPRKRSFYSKVNWFTKIKSSVYQAKSRSRQKVLLKRRQDWILKRKKLKTLLYIIKKERISSRDYHSGFAEKHKAISSSILKQYPHHIQNEEHWGNCHIPDKSQDSEEVK